MKNIFSKNKNLIKLIKKGDEFYLPGQQALFWRRAVILFFICLLLVLIVYAVALYLILSARGIGSVSGESASLTIPIINEKKINRAVTEIKKRQKNFAEIASSTPTMIDPSL
ncbi:MAG: hypothetical protein NTV48_00300 [Candidatus Vogelbacteria bacterium]|nr:hypothetical protein [Candidatus Vogelbacteria bacterium]